MTGRTFDQHVMPAENKKAARRLRLWNRKLARRSAAQTAKSLKLARRHKTSRRKGVRLRRSAGFLEASAQIAKRQAHEANMRNDVHHKVSRAIVDSGDHLSIERLDVAGMMRRADHRAAKRQRRQERLRKARGQDVPIRHKAPAKVLRKADWRAAMARLLGYIRYKAQDGNRVVTETHVLMPRVQKCGNCGRLNAAMKDGRPKHECSGCGTVLHRQENAAYNMQQLGEVTLASGLIAAE